MRYRCLFVVMALGLSCLFCPSNTLEAKLYLNQRDVCLAKEGIFVAIKGNVFLTPSLFSDEHGLYVESASLLQARGKFSKWWCPRCKKTDHNKSAPDASCTDCNWPTAHLKDEKHHKGKKK